jgi:hypothetical protein
LISGSSRFSEPVLNNGSEAAFRTPAGLGTATGIDADAAAASDPGALAGEGIGSAAAGGEGTGTGTRGANGSTTEIVGVETERTVSIRASI